MPLASMGDCGLATGPSFDALSRLREVHPQTVYLHPVINPGGLLSGLENKGRPAEAGRRVPPT